MSCPYVCDGSSCLVLWDRTVVLINYSPKRLRTPYGTYCSNDSSDHHVLVCFSFFLFSLLYNVLIAGAKP